MDARTLNGRLYKINLSEHLRIGQRIKIDLKQLESHFYTELVGFCYGNYILVKMPNTRKYGTIGRQIAVSDEVVVRTIFENTNGDCIVFKSSVDDIITKPEPLLVIKFPKQGVTRQLRKEQRKQINVDAQILLHKPNGQEVKVPGLLIDLSDHGCGFEFFTDQFKKVKHQKLTIEYISPENSKACRHTVEIKHQHKYGNKIVLGLVFTDALPSAPTTTPEDELDGLELDYDSDYLNYDAQQDVTSEPTTKKKSKQPSTDNDYLDDPEDFLDDPDDFLEDPEDFLADPEFGELEKL